MVTVVLFVHLDVTLSCHTQILDSARLECFYLFFSFADKFFMQSTINIIIAPIFEVDPASEVF